MVKVTVDGKTIAESNEAVTVENNYYFPPDSVNKSYFSDSKTRCDLLRPSIPPVLVPHLTFPPFVYTALFVHGKGLPSPIPPATIR